LVRICKPSVETVMRASKKTNRAGLEEPRTRPDVMLGRLGGSINLVEPHCADKY
jgi:hypothetical protein